MAIHGIALLLQGGSGESTLTLRTILADIPHDGPAFFLYALLLASGWLIWKGSRKRKPPES
jgi:hypothetical protein